MRRNLAIWGEAVWRGFFDATPLARATLERHLVGDEKMQSVFAAVRLLHGPLCLAYGAQAATALAAAAALFWLQRRDFRGSAKGRRSIAATLLASPFLLDYDLTLLAIPLAFRRAKGSPAALRRSRRASSSSPIFCRCCRASSPARSICCIAAPTIAAMLCFVAAAGRRTARFRH